MAAASPRPAPGGHAGPARARGRGRFRLFAIDVLTIRDGLITEVIAFGGDALQPFDLPRILDGAAS